MAEQAQGADPEDRDEYLAEGIFWVPKEARWSVLRAAAKQPEIGSLIDKAMEAIERENPKLKDVLPKGYARPTLDKRRLGELIDLISNIGPGRERAPVKRHTWASLRILPSSVRVCGRQEGRRVLHSAIRGTRPGRKPRSL